MSIGERLRQIRKARGWTQLEAAHRSGVDTAGISRLERGKQTYTQQSLEGLAEAYGVPVREFFSNEPVAPYVVVSDEEHTLIREFRDLPDHIQAQLRQQLHDEAEKARRYAEQVRAGQKAAAPEPTPPPAEPPPRPADLAADSNVTRLAFDGQQSHQIHRGRLAKRPPSKGKTKR